MDGVLVQWPFRSSRSWSRPVTVLRDEGLDPSEGVDGSSESDVPSLLRSLKKAGTKVQMSKSDGNADVTMAESIISSAPRAGGFRLAHANFWTQLNSWNV